MADAAAAEVAAAEAAAADVAASDVVADAVLSAASDVADAADAACPGDVAAGVSREHCPTTLTDVIVVAGPCFDPAISVLFAARPTPKRMVSTVNDVQVSAQLYRQALARELKQ